MSIEISQHKYVNMDYKVKEKPGRQKGRFAAQVEAASSGQEVNAENRRELFQKYMEEMRKEHEERRVKQLEKEQGMKVEPNKIIEEETYPVR